MRGERDLAGIIILCLERVLIGIERDFGIDHQQFVARHAHDRIGAQAAFVGFDRLLGDEIGMFGQPALFEHVAQLQFAPAATRFGAIAQAVAQLRSGGAHRLLPIAHRLDQPGQLAKALDAVLLQLADLLLITFEPLINGREQRRKPLGAGLFALIKAGAGAGEKRILRLFQHAIACVFKFLAQRFLRLDQQALLLGKIEGICFQPGQFAARFFAFGAGQGQFGLRFVGIAGALAGGGELGGEGIALTANFIRLLNQRIKLGCFDRCRC